MRFDLHADLAGSRMCPTDGQLPVGLASGFVDGCTAWSIRGNDQKNEARICYMRRAQQENLKLPQDLELDSDAGELPDSSWICFEIAFRLETPWYSKDDRPFHVLDNPVCKDRVFGVPFMSAASWKGLLRWAFRMITRVIGPDPEVDVNKIAVAKAMEFHLFGNEREENEAFQRGALAFRPTWFSRIGFEVINPHSRITRAGTQPIYYEVVPACTTGVLRLLYAPVPRTVDRSKVKRAEALDKLFDAVEALLTVYGFSAKRTVGWGTAKIEKWTAARRDKEAIGEETSVDDFKEKIRAWLKPLGDAT